MLYDPKWEVEIKADPFSLDSLIAWLETKDPDQRYDYNACDGMCLLGFYAVEVIGTHWRQPNSPLRYSQLSGAFDDAACIAVGDAGSDGWTFGAALERARFARDNL